MGARALAHRGELKGKNLACWCALDEPCPRRRAAALRERRVRLRNARRRRPGGGIPDSTRPAKPHVLAATRQGAGADVLRDGLANAFRQPVA